MEFFTGKIDINASSRSKYDTRYIALEWEGTVVGMSYSNQLSMSDSKDEINTNLYSELSFKSNWFIARTKYILSTVNLEIFSTILKIKIKHELKSPETCLFC